MTVHICMIADENYVLPTSVAIRSMCSTVTASDYCIHIVTSKLSAEAEARFRQLETDKVKIDIIREDAEARFAGMHTFTEGAICVASIAALLKFILPALFPELDRILYLDGDLIVKTDLGELYATELGESYAATVTDSGSMYYQHAYTNAVQRYFNSGVMLLNLAKMREDGISEKLIETKRSMTDNNLMDQDAFNVVFDGKTVALPIIYNYLPVNLDRSKKWKITDVNRLFGTEFSDKKELDAAARIVHYSSKDKPWKDFEDGKAYTCARYNDWVAEYKKLPFAGELPLPINAEKCEVMLSVIMPCYNTERYVAETLDSLLAQSFRDFEIICIDDGSTDGTLSVLKQYAEAHENITVIADSNHHVGYQRNAGIEAARGKYVYYMDSDDLLEPQCFETLVGCMERCALDLILFEGSSFYETPVLEEQFPQYKTLYTRKHLYPRIMSGEKFYVLNHQREAIIIQPCMQMARRSFLTQEGIRFPEIPAHEDVVYTIEVLLHAKRMMCLPDAFYRRRVREGSIVTDRSEKSLAEKRSSYIFITRYLLTAASRYPNDSEISEILHKSIRYFFASFGKVLANSGGKAPCELSEADEAPDALLLMTMARCIAEAEAERGQKNAQLREYKTKMKELDHRRRKGIHAHSSERKRGL